MKRQALTVLGVALAYWALAQFNAAVLAPISWARFGQGVDWVYLPSGLRLVAVLAFGLWGCLGIGLATLLLSISGNPGDPWLVSLGTALISGFSPWLAYQVGRWWLQIPQDLNGLTAWQLIQLAALFAITSGSLHQTWYQLTGHTANAITSAGVMMVGDFLGSLVVLFLLSWGLRSLNRMP